MKGNDNFIAVKQSDIYVGINDIYKSFFTKHIDQERRERLSRAFKLNEHNGTQAPIDKVFLVDKGHKNGPELHCVSKKGIIFILNRDKFLHNENSFVTILIARPNQVIRLYRWCHLYAQKSIIDNCLRNTRNHQNV